jgi:glycine cleavage system H protein
VNASLTDAPEQVNAEPYGAGWLVVIDPSDLSELDALLDATAYRATTE